MKRIVSILVLTMLLLSSVMMPVQAAGDIRPEVLPGASKVTISGVETELAGLPLTLKIVDGGGTVKYLNQTLIAADGTYSFVVGGLSQGESYTYSLRHPRQAQVSSDSFYIPTEGDETNVLGAFVGLNVNENNPNRVSDMTDFLTAPLSVQILNIDIDSFNALENPAAVSLGMCDAHAGLTSLELISTKFAELVRAQAEAEETARQNAVLVQTIASSELGDMLDLIEANKTRLGIKTKYGFAKIQSNFDNGDNALAQKLKDAISGAQTPDELNEAVSGVLALIAFNDESWGKYEDIDQYYKEDIGSIFGDAKAKLTDLELTDVKQKVQAETFADLDELKTFIENRTTAIIEGRKEPSTGGVPSRFEGGIKVVKDNDQPLVPENNPVATDFTDCEHVSWAKDSILRLKELGIVNGKSATAFGPDDKTKREEFLKMLLLSCGITPDTEASAEFADVPSGSWYAPYIKTAVELGVVTGISETEFGVGREITRQDMAVLCYRMLTYLNKTMPDADGNVFADEATISAYATDAVKAMQTMGIIKGMDDNRFEPSVLATRAQTAVIIDRLMNLK